MNLADVPIKSHWCSVRSGKTVEIIRISERSQSVLLKYLSSGTMRWHSILKFRKIFDPRREVRSKCRRGHELSGENLYMTPNGRRQCRECKAMATRRWRSTSEPEGQPK